MKKVLLLVFLLSAFCMEAFARKTVTIDNIEYELAPDWNPSYAIIIGSSITTDSSRNYPTLRIPAKIKYGGKILPVRGINSSVFKWCPSKKVVIPETVEYIDSRAFENCYYLEEVVFENATEDSKYLEAYTGIFDGCPIEKVTLGRSFRNPTGPLGLFSGQNITTIELTSGIDFLPKYIFAECNHLKSVKIPGTIIWIDESAFQNCSELSEIILEEGIREIKRNAFRGCSKLTDIQLPTSLRSLSGFADCNGLEHVIIPEGVKELSYTFIYCTNLKSVSWPSTIEVMNSTFFGCENLKPFDLTSRLRIIEEDSFSGCKLFTSVTIPKSVQYIGEYAFSNIDLTELIIEDDPHTLQINIFCFRELGSDGLHTYPTTIKKLHLGRPLSTTRETEKSMFSECHLEEFTMSPTLTRLPDYFFKEWTEETWPGIKKIDLPWSLTELGKQLFYGSECEHVTIYSGVKTIREGCFNKCQNLNKLTVISTNPPNCYLNTFDEDNYANVELIVPIEALETYKKTVPWKYFSNISGADFSDILSGIESIDVNNASEAASVEWYNLSGLRVSGEDMPAGIYLRRQGPKIEKIVVR